MYMYRVCVCVIELNSVTEYFKMNQRDFIDLLIHLLTLFE